MLKDLPNIDYSNLLDGPDSALIKFYEDLGWDKKKTLEPTKVKLNKNDWGKLLEAIVSLGPKEEAMSIRFMFVNYGPSTGDIEEGKVLLEDNWMEG